MSVPQRGRYTAHEALITQIKVPKMDSLHDDLLTGAQEIAAYLNWPVRRVYHAARQGYLPVGRCGALLVGRKSELNAALSGSAKKSVEAA